LTSLKTPSFTVAAYRAALEEWTRERVPLDCATTQNNLGLALWGLASGRAGRRGSSRRWRPIAPRWRRGVPGDAQRFIVVAQIGRRLAEALTAARSHEYALWRAPALAKVAQQLRLTQPDEELRGFRGFVEHRELGGRIYVQGNFPAVVDDPRALCLFLKLGGHELSASAASACRVPEIHIAFGMVT
jgi:hypothetical protein